MSRILDAIGRLLPAGAMRPEAKASAVGPLIAWEPLGEPVWSPRDYAAFAREGFMQNAIVYRGVRMIAEAAASVPLLLYAGDAEIEAHALLDLLARPSPDHTATDFREAWYGFLLVAGNAYVEAAAVGGRLRELYVLRPDRMKVVPGPSGWPEAFEYAANGTSVRFSEELLPGVRPILHTRLFHPDNDHYGMSPIEAAAAAIDIHNQASAWNKALLDNSARPSGALVYAANGGNLTGEQFTRLRGELEAAFQGARNAGRPMLLEGGLDWKPLSLSPKDMDFIAGKHAAAREIALALGVPPMLLGIPGDNTYSNYSEAQRAFWRGTVLPLVSRMAKAFSAWLAPAYGGGLELKPDLDQVEGLSAEREALWARIDKVSFLTLDEKRAAVGYGPAPREGIEPQPAPEPAFGGEAKFFVGAGDSPAGSRPPTQGVKYSPDQPRVPPGNSGGGQWTDGGGGGGGSGGSDRGPIPANSDSGASEEGRSFELVQNTTQDGDEPPQIPKNPPPSKRKGPSLAKNIVATLNRAGKIAALVAGSTPSGRAIKITSLLIEYYPDVSDWVEENIVPYIVSYFDEPKDLETLHSAVSNPAPGYQTHHIAEQEAARIDGFPKELIDGYDNTVRIPTLKHWEVTGWFGRSNKRFGGLSPREYLRGKSWEERTKVGLEALIERGVLKP